MDIRQPSPARILAPLGSYNGSATTSAGTHRPKTWISAFEPGAASSDGK